MSDLFQTVVKVQKIMETVHNAESSTICVQDGKYAGQTIPVCCVTFEKLETTNVVFVLACALSHLTKETR